ncbi:MAG: hypothetical protein FWD67_03840 [Betaproteobacteria bacterium]|nr:hypothetical protein [Betaproteobacteria bacterium]
MSPDALTVQTRTRAHWEAIDLGFALVQAHWRNLYAAWLVVILPATLLALTLAYLSNRDGKGIMYGLVLLWWLKPLYDRVLLHVMSRAVFGETVSWRGTLRAIPGLLLHSGLFRALTWRRFSPQRSFRLPTWQLEGVTGQARRRRLRALNGRGAIRLIFVCSTFETILSFGMVGLLLMLLPPESILSHLKDAFVSSFKVASYFIYLFVITIIEPFYVAAGFMLYLNQRTELEGWDIELGFRTLANRLATQQAPS